MAAGLTLERAAELAGLSCRTVRFWEAGAVQPTNRSRALYERAVATQGAVLQQHLLWRLGHACEATEAELARWCCCSLEQARAALGPLHSLRLVLDLGDGWWAIAPAPKET